MKDAGFTLVEMAMAVAAMAVLALGIFQLPGLFMQQEKMVASVVTKDRIFKSFAQNFIQIAERADVALRFEYLPIPVSCSGDGPCIRRLVDGKELAPATVSATSSSMQFFSDQEGSLSEYSPFAESASHNVVKVLARRPITFASTNVRSEYYATWPLATSTSPPFPLLTRSEHNDHFFMVDEFVNSSSTSRWVIVEGIRPNFPIDQLLGRPIVVYSANDFSQYLMQKVATALNCSEPARKAECTTAVQTLKPTFDPDVDTAFFTSRRYAIELSPYSQTDLDGFLPSLGLSPTAWGLQSPALFLFPTQAMSLISHSTTSEPWVQDVRQVPADTKRFSHMQHTLPPTLQGSVVLVPVNLLSFRLVDVLDKDSHPIKRTLKMQTLGSSKVITVLEDIPLSGSIVFARRLGTTELEVLQFE